MREDTEPGPRTPDAEVEVRDGFAYTVHDTPSVRRRIGSDLRHVVATVRDGDPAARSVILTGGFARGEGAVVAGRPQNDYDLVVVRGPGRTRRGYDEMRQELEEALGLHMDLAPVPSWRLPFTPSSIFWYETARTGQTIWGEELRPRIGTRRAGQIPADEGLRLLVNRAAGLVLYQDADPHMRRIQAAKALLAALDAHLLTRGVFAPSQTLRWRIYAQMLDAPLETEWLEWAYRFKTDPENAPRRDAGRAWLCAAKAIRTILPDALRHAGHDDLASYARSDGLADHLGYALRSRGLRRRLAWNPTGSVRQATLEMLEQAMEGKERTLPPHLRRLVPDVDDVAALDRLRQATLQ